MKGKQTARPGGAQRVVKRICHLVVRPIVTRSGVCFDVIAVRSTSECASWSPRARLPYSSRHTIEGIA